MEPIRSCLGYKDGKTGKYTVIDGAGKPYQVFCQFTKDYNFGWTLIQPIVLKIKISLINH